MTLLPPAFHFTTPSASSSSSSSPLPPAGTHLIISDTPGASSDFCFYSLVASAVREKKPVTIVDFGSRGRSHWEGVGKKIGTPLPPRSSSSLRYLAPSPESLFDPSTDDPSLAELWDDLITSSSSFDTPAGSNPTPPAAPNDKTEEVAGMIVLVGFSELIWQGFEPELLGRISRALLGVCRSTKRSLITQLHTPILLSPSLSDHLSAGPTSDPELDLLLRLLRAGQGGGVWWRVEELKSGRSGVVHGEISIHPLSPRSSRIQARVPYTSPLQYRLDDGVVRVFPKGTGRGYL